MLLRTAALAEIGGVDSSYFLYFDDVDLSLRLQGAGYSVLQVPGARVYHEGGRLRGVDRVYYSTRNQLRVLRSKVNNNYGGLV